MLLTVSVEIENFVFYILYALYDLRTRPHIGIKGRWWKISQNMGRTLDILFEIHFKLVALFIVCFHLCQQYEENWFD